MSAKRRKKFPRWLKKKINAKDPKKKLANGLVNLSKRCKQPRSVIRPWLEAVFTRLEAGITCPYCGVKLTCESLSYDHRQPISRAGELWGDNLVPCCLTCNKIKGPLTDGEYIALLLCLSSFPEEAYLNVTRRLRLGAAAMGRFWSKRK